MKWDIVSGQVGCGSSEMATEFVISMNSEIISRVWGHLARKNFIRYILYGHGFVASAINSFIQTKQYSGIQRSFASVLRATAATPFIK